ncbi:MAG: hypothetical protein IJS91_06290 [Bacteroidales bacterium]|nr:hypothetical protein [Bacteroidales bacterium]
MKSRFFFLIAICLTLLLTGCGNPREIALTGYAVDKIDAIRFEEGGVHTTLYLKLGVNNPTGKKLTVKSLKADVKKENGDRFAELTTIEEVSAPKHFNDTIPVALDVLLYNPMALMFDGGLDIHSMKADVDAQVAWGSLKRNVVRTDLPIAKLLENGPAKDKL